jgi:hypothetical protein
LKDALECEGLFAPIGVGHGKFLISILICVLLSIARARRGADPREIVADTHEFGDQGRGGVRLQAALCALELLMPVSDDDAAAAPSP